MENSEDRREMLSDDDGWTFAATKRSPQICYKFKKYIYKESHLVVSLQTQCYILRFS